RAAARRREGTLQKRRRPRSARSIVIDFTARKYYEDVALRASRSLVLSALMLAVGKLFLLPLHDSPPTAFLIDLTDFGLTLLLSVAAWRSAYRSRLFSRIVWAGVGTASALWAISFGIGTFASLSSTLEDALGSFWPTTIIFYLVGVAFGVPLLLSEDPK